MSIRNIGSDHVDAAELGMSLRRLRQRSRPTGIRAQSGTIAKLYTLLEGTGVDPKLVSAARGVLAAGGVSLGEFLLNHLGVTSPGAWQATLPALAAAWRLFEGVLLDTGKPQ